MITINNGDKPLKIILSQQVQKALKKNEISLAEITETLSETEEIQQENSSFIKETENFIFAGGISQEDPSCFELDFFKSKKGKIKTITLE